MTRPQPSFYLCDQLHGKADDLTGFRRTDDTGGIINAHASLFSEAIEPMNGCGIRTNGKDERLDDAKVI